jgi:hypothetical protein
MKKQNLKKKFVSKFGGDGEEIEISQEKPIVGGNPIPGYISAFIKLSYGVIFITSLVLLSQFIYNLKSEFILATNRQALCKDIIYENETVRNRMYMLFKDSSLKNKFQETYKVLFSILFVLCIVIIIMNVKEFGIKHNPDDFFPELPFSSLLSISTLIILFGGIYLVTKKLDSLYRITSDYASKISTLKQLLFTKENLNERQIAYDLQNKIIPVVDNSYKTNGALVTLEDSILRRILHTDDSGNILKIADANAKYDTLRQSDPGQDILIGYVEFTRNTDDYNLLQASVCGTNICEQGIGKHIKAMSAKDFAAFIAKLKTFPSTNDNSFPTTSNTTPSSATTGWLVELTTLVKEYDVELAKLLSLLSYDSPTWTALKEINNQADIQTCECRGNPLNRTSKEKMSILSILNYLATQSNGDPTLDIQRNMASFQTYLIICYAFISYFIFHMCYIINKKQFIGGYFVFLLILAIFLGLSARLR